MNDITFYQRFEADILAGRKNITIRDKSESHFKAGDILRVGRFEDNQYFCTIEVLSVSPITLDELTEQHAKQENMTLGELREVIQGIYPDENIFYLIRFSLGANDMHLIKRGLGFVEFIFIFIVSIVFIVFLSVISKSSLDSIIVIMSLIGLIFNNLEKDYPKIELYLRKFTIYFIQCLNVAFVLYGVMYILGGGAKIWYILDKYIQNQDLLIVAKDKAKEEIILLGIPLVILGGILYFLKNKITTSKGMAYSVYFFVILIIYLFFTIQDKQFISDWNIFMSLI